jgi:hypothetical protein
MNLFVVDERLRLLSKIKSVDVMANRFEPIQIGREARQYWVDIRPTNSGRTTHGLVEDLNRFHNDITLVDYLVISSIIDEIRFYESKKLKLGNELFELG